MSKAWNDLLPTSVDLFGTRYNIRSDYRAILDVCVALNDPELDDQDRAIVVLNIFYPDFDEIPVNHYSEAIRLCFWFLNCGEEEKQNKNPPKLVDWEKDFKYIVAPINRVTGKEIRNVNYMHWWTFIAAYYEIGDCLFAQIVRIRDKLSNRKPLDKQDREWYKQNRSLVDMKNKYTENDNKILEQWIGTKQ